MAAKESATTERPDLLQREQINLEIATSERLPAVTDSNDDCQIIEQDEDSQYEAAEARIADFLDREDIIILCIEDKHSHAKSMSKTSA